MLKYSYKPITKATFAYLPSEERKLYFNYEIKIKNYKSDIKIIHYQFLIVNYSNSQNYNRYAYVLNNPLKYSDPDGNFIFTALALITCQWWAIPMAIGADIGTWQGGAMANKGELNPLKWDYNSGKTWGGMIGGAAVGGASAGAGNAIAGSGIIFAKTAGIMAGSLINSAGNSALSYALTGQATDISMSLGLGSWNMSKGSFSTFSSNNSVLENIGYGLGAMANLSDGLKVLDKFTGWEGKLKSRYESQRIRQQSEANNFLNDDYIDKSKAGLFGSNSVGSDGAKIIGSNNNAFVSNPSLSDITSGFHDLGWENSGMNGGIKAFFGSVKAIKADWQLVGRSMYLGIKNITSNYGTLALSLGAAISFIPKTILYPILR